MNKSICVLAVVLAALVFTSGSRSADASPTAPLGSITVAHVKLPNQTAPIPTTTIFTPSHDGLYQLSVYMTQTVAVITSGAYWTFNLGWSDDAGNEATGQILLNVNQTPGFGNVTLLLEAKAGTPITYSTTLSNGADGGTYSLYFTLERLE